MPDFLSGIGDFLGETIGGVLGGVGSVITPLAGSIGGQLGNQLLDEIGISPAGPVAPTPTIVGNPGSPTQPLAPTGGVLTPSSITPAGFTPAGAQPQNGAGGVIATVPEGMSPTITGELQNGLQPALVPQVVMRKGFHDPESGVSYICPRKKPRMNPLNPRALKRSIQRVNKFRCAIKGAEKALPTKTVTRRASSKGCKC